jgi:hypothetical protein
MKHRTVLAIQSDFTTIPIGPIQHGPKGTDETVAAIWGIVKDAAADPGIKLVARRLGHPEELYHYLRAHVRFVPDPAGVELIRTPQAILRTIQKRGFATGDCDDLATFGAALLRAMGREPVLVVTGRPRKGSPRAFRHILFGFVAERVAWPRGVAFYPIHAKPQGSHGFAGPVALLMDPQERRPIGHTVPEPIRRIYRATGEHA